MYKIAILGCENSHADMFLDYIYGAKSEDGTSKPPLVNDVSVVGVFSEDMAAAENRVTDRVNKTCKNILYNTAVYKPDQNGADGFDRFLNSLNIN